MKKISKILAVLLTLTMLFSTVGYAASFSDVNSENNFYESIQILSGLGIINGYTDGTFGPERDVTRAEFATMLMRAMASAGIGSPDPAGTPFKDLNDAAWAIGDVKTAYDLGIINGMTATTFEPNSKVTYEQALKMIVCALNYGGQADAVYKSAVATNPNTKWYYGYVQTAKSLGLTDNVVVMQEQPAKRAQIAQMIYNALDVNMLEKIEVAGGEAMYMESNQNWLKDKLKVTRVQGELLADESNTISSDGATARPGYALLSDNTTNKNNTIHKNGISLDGLLGKSVEYYYKTDMDGLKSLVLIYGKAGSNISMKIDAVNIDRISGNYDDGYTVSYYENATAIKAKTLKVSAKPIISFNGEVRTNVSVADLNIESGSLEFMSNGGDYNKINVEAFETYVVKSVNRTDKYIVDMYRTAGSNTLYLDDEDSNYIINIKNASGSSVGITNISQYNVLTVKKGKGNGNRTSVDVTVSNKNVSGSIKEIDVDYVNINGTEYQISAYLDKYSGSALDSFRVGDACKAYLDKDGKIAYITKSASSSSFFGYISTASAKDDVVRVAIVSQKTPSMGSPYVNLAKRVKIDGETYTNTDTILELLKGSAGEANTNIDGNKTDYSQLVKYTINAAGEITDIDTAYISEDEDPADETTLKAFAVARKSGNLMQYKSSSYDFIGASNSDKFRINSSTQVFLVPLDRTEFESYGRKSSSFFKDGQQYVVEPYNVTGGLNIAEAVIVYETEATEAKVEYNTPIFIISSISQTTNADGNTSDRVVGYQISSNGTVTANKEYYTASDGVVYGEYSVGDVLVFVTDNKGYIKEDTIILALDADNFEAGKKVIKEGSTTHQTELYKGLLLGADYDGESTTVQMFDMELVDTPAECTGELDYSGRTSSSTKFFVYDPEAKGADKLTQQDGFDLTSLASYNETIETGTPLAAKLFIYEYYGAVRAIIVVK